MVVDTIIKNVLALISIVEGADFFITAFHSRCVVSSIGGGCGIVWMQRSKLHQWSNLVAETIQIDGLVCDGWIRIIWG